MKRLLAFVVTAMAMTGALGTSAAQADPIDDTVALVNDIVGPAVPTPDEVVEGLVKLSLLQS